jgi:arginine-tRNA-protein transferase
VLPIIPAFVIVTAEKEKGDIPTFLILDASLTDRLSGAPRCPAASRSWTRRRPGRERRGAPGIGDSPIMSGANDRPIVYPLPDPGGGRPAFWVVRVSPNTVQKMCAYPALAPPARVPLVVLPQHPCPYLPGRKAEDRAFWAASMPASVYEQFMNAGFRRSGHLVYQPACRGCRQCLSLRVPVNEFRPGKSFRRCERRNQDLVVSYHAPLLTDEKFDLYGKYVREWHGKAEVDGPDALESFLYDSPLESTLEFEYRDQQARLLGVGICDVCSTSLSSVYFYFDPDHALRGLGTFAALYELAFAAEHALPYYYMGYWVKDCSAMNYKSNFRPNQILETDGVWRRLTD